MEFYTHKETDDDDDDGEDDDADGDGGGAMVVGMMRVLMTIAMQIMIRRK